MEFFFIYLVFGIVSFFLMLFLAGIVDWEKLQQPEEEEPTVDLFKFDDDPPTPHPQAPAKVLDPPTAPPPTKKLAQDSLLDALSTKKRQEFFSNFRIHLADYVEKRNLRKLSIFEGVSWEDLDLFLGHHSSEAGLEDSLVSALDDEFCKELFDRFKRWEQLRLMEAYVKEFPPEILRYPRTVEGEVFAFISKSRGEDPNAFSEDEDESVDNFFRLLLEKQSGFRFMLENDQLAS